ncbi:MAG: ABC transporter permease [Anaerolineae bacterium]|nr:ABC transporter permease [Anaerolineae bacterium]
MRNILAIAKREVASFMLSPIIYLVTAAFLLLTGLYFWLTLTWMVEYGEPPTVRYTIEFMIVVFVFAGPLLTMRLLAQEKRMGTLELLLTSPVREGELVLGKFLAGLAFYVLMVAPTLLYPLVLEIFGNPDWGPVWSSYLGLLLFGWVFLSIGTLASAVTQNQIVAAVLGVAGNLGLWLFVGAPATDPNIDPRLADVLRILDLQQHLDGFLSGAIDTKDIFYCLSVTVLMLFVATRVLEARRWQA